MPWIRTMRDPVVIECLHTPDDLFRSVVGITRVRRHDDVPRTRHGNDPVDRLPHFGVVVLERKTDAFAEIRARDHHRPEPLGPHDLIQLPQGGAALDRGQNEAPLKNALMLRLEFAARARIFPGTRTMPIGRDADQRLDLGRRGNRDLDDRNPKAERAGGVHRHLHLVRAVGPRVCRNTKAAGHPGRFGGAKDMVELLPVHRRKHHIGTHIIESRLRQAGNQMRAALEPNSECQLVGRQLCKEPRHSSILYHCFYCFYVLRAALHPALSARTTNGPAKKTKAHK